MGSLQPGQLAVDSLTVDSLRLRLTDIEHRLKEVTTELREKQNLLNQHETEVAGIRKGVGAGGGLFQESPHVASR